MKRFLIAALGAVFLLCLSCCGQKHTFAISGGEFLYDGEPLKIYSGEMHYSRIPCEYWRHRLQMMKAMGLNTVATYVFWNHHETAPGVWDWETGNRNIREFCRIAQDEGMHVILRSGPYSCGEWDFGGYPWWLQTADSMVVRADNRAFLDSCRVYIGELAGQVRDLQVTHGGPILMVQAENEFGSYVAQRKDVTIESHRKYLESICGILKEAGFDIPMFTSDATSLFQYGAVEGALPTGNGEHDIDRLKKSVDEYHGGEGPYMVAEFYPGWLDHWGEPFQKTSVEAVTDQIRKYLDAGISFNFYMVHGGTNFGFTSGANYSDETNIQPDITSYDYDAPISEAGWSTEKYMAVREMMKQHLPYEIPDVPDRIPVVTPTISLQKSAALFPSLEKPVVSVSPLDFEQLGQGNGFVLYRRHFDKAAKGTLLIDGLADYGIVYVDGRKVGHLDRTLSSFSTDVDIPAGGALDIFVENMGRINYGSRITENRKGIVSPVFIGAEEITGGWEMYSVPMDTMPEPGLSPAVQGQPALYAGKFDLDSVGDVFLDMSSWGKGLVFVNGINLGRYWNIGPQQTLYLPGCWLREKDNAVVVFEMENDSVMTALGSRPEPLLDSLVR